MVRSVSSGRNKSQPTGSSAFSLPTSPSCAADAAGADAAIGPTLISLRSATTTPAAPSRTLRLPCWTAGRVRDDRRNQNGVERHRAAHAGGNHVQNSLTGTRSICPPLRQAGPQTNQQMHRRAPRELAARGLHDGENHGGARSWRRSPSRPLVLFVVVLLGLTGSCGGGGADAR